MPLVDLGFLTCVLMFTEICLIGSSFISRLEDELARAKEVMRVPLHSALAGFPGLTMRRLPKVVRQTVKHHHKVVLLHVGANDLSSTSSWEWLRCLQESVYYVRARFPHIMLIWSDMLPRGQWRNMAYDKAEKKRKRLQLLARKLIGEEGGRVCRHNKVLFQRNLAYDKVHLSKLGMMMFRGNLEEAICNAVFI